MGHIIPCIIGAQTISTGANDFLTFGYRRITGQSLPGARSRALHTPRRRHLAGGLNSKPCPEKSLSQAS
jgi:hypothetical protein